MTRPNLTPERLDAILGRNATSRDGRDRIIWTAEAIGRRLDCSADFVRDRLVSAPGSPIRKVGGRFCVHEADLIAWLRG